MNSVALRTFSTKGDAKKQSPYTYKQEMPDFSRVLTFDTETTADMYFNLKFGSFMVNENDVYQYAGLFWDTETRFRKRV